MESYKIGRAEASYFGPHASRYVAPLGGSVTSITENDDNKDARNGNVKYYTSR